MYAIMAQFVLPVLEDKVVGENFLSLSILSAGVYIASPSVVCWLLMFYGLFVGFTNTLAELTWLGDRSFYSNWWNSTSLDVFWRKWYVV